MVSTGQERAAPVADNGVVPAVDQGVLADQQLLARSGFYDGAPNGVPDENHTVAIRRAREALGLPGGIRLDAARAKLEQRIGVAQRGLRDLGFYNGPVNGIADLEFDSALRAFQLREGLPTYSQSPTPILDDAARARMALRATEAKSPAPPTPPTRQTPPAQAPLMTAAPAPTAGSTAVVIVVGAIGLIAGFTWAALLFNRR